MKFSSLNLNKAGWMLLLLAWSVSISGCNQATLNAVVKKNSEAEQQRAHQLSTSLGQRTFKLSQTKLMKAFVNAFSSKNLSVTALEISAGLMIAEGPSSAVQGRPYSMFGGYAVPNLTLKITVNLYEKKGGQTLAKVMINPIYENCILCNVFDDCPETRTLSKAHCSLSPEMLPLWYQEMWDEIEKSIFMQRETILN